MREQCMSSLTSFTHFKFVLLHEHILRSRLYLILCYEPFTPLLLCSQLHNVFSWICRYLAIYAAKFACLSAFEACLKLTCLALLATNVDNIGARLVNQLAIPDHHLRHLDHLAHVYISTRGLKNCLKGLLFHHA